jgi:hypothetical protein
MPLESSDSESEFEIREYAELQAMQPHFEERDEAEENFQQSENVRPTGTNATNTRNTSYKKGTRRFTVWSEFKKKHMVKDLLRFIFAYEMIILG